LQFAGTLTRAAFLGAIFRRATHHYLNLTGRWRVI
jgi:hypothetical protein